MSAVSSPVVVREGRGMRRERFVPLRALEAGLLSVGRVDEIRVVLADVGEAGVVGGSVGGVRPVVHVAHCGAPSMHVNASSTHSNTGGRDWLGVWKYTCNPSTNRFHDMKRIWIQNPVGFLKTWIGTLAVKCSHCCV